jgi:methanethiol S-methyltransferase
MGGPFALLYGAVAYLLFLAVFIYAIAFVGDLPVPKTIDSAPFGPLVPSLIVDVLLLGVFAVEHSVMARRGFKQWWTRIVPRSVERSTFVLFATAALALLLWQWRPLPQPVWSIDAPVGSVLQVIFWVGWTTVLGSTFLINHFELFGLRQVYARLRGQELPHPPFRTPLLYKHVRHPIYAGFVLAFWAVPQMSLGHLVFAIATTGYILVGIWFEERDLIAHFGDRYRRYRNEVPMLVPLPRRGPTPDAAQSDRP